MNLDDRQGESATPEESFGMRLRIARERRGRSTTEIARLLGVSERTLKRWEADKATPRSNRMHVIAGTLNVHMRWLISGDGEITDTGEEPAVLNDALLEELRALKDLVRRAASRAAVLEDQIHTMARQAENGRVDPET
jgi:transcriptional regulator with XRE-family HTH domain